MVLKSVGSILCGYKMSGKSNVSVHLASKCCRTKADQATCDVPEGKKHPRSAVSEGAGLLRLQ